MTRRPGRDALSRWDSADWDGPTREVVRRRLTEIPPIRFFTAAEARLLDAIAMRILPQAERPAAERIPITPWIDAKLFEDRTDGYRYEDLPPQREAWRRGLLGIEEAAGLLFEAGFADLDDARQDEVIRRVQDGSPPGETWRTLPARRFFGHLLLLTIVKTYYAHPTAWREAGYGGPSSPRGHVRTWEGGVDPWEPDEP